MPAAEIQMAIASAKALGDICKGLLSLHIDSQVKEGIIKAQNETLQLQSHMFDILAKFEQLTNENRELNKQLDERDRWEDDAKKYELFHPAEGMTVYKNTTDQEIWACPNCFGNHKISFLNKPMAENINFKCHACGFEIIPTKIEQPRRRPPSGWTKPY